MVQRTFGMPGTAPVAAAPPLRRRTPTRPNGLLTFPIATPKQTLPFAPITFTGTATDNVGVNQVRISLKRLSNNTVLERVHVGLGIQLDVPVLGHDARHAGRPFDRLDMGMDAEGEHRPR